jgi:hypothetical protein
MIAILPPTSPTTLTGVMTAAGGFGTSGDDSVTTKKNNIINNSKIRRGVAYISNSLQTTAMSCTFP